MKDIKIKSFILSKEPESNVCQDSLSVNLKRGRFAVADGVTNSNHPEIIARLLSEAFVVEEIAIEDWPTVFEEKALEKICKDWKEEEESIFSSLTGRKRSQAQLRRDYYSPGASTLAGIEIDKDKKALRFLILGDSTLFVIGSDGTYFAVNSDANCSKRGLLLPFNNTPGTVVANGKVNGQWVSGQCNLQEGYIALMTDGCANWFQETYANDTSIIEKLWELKDNGEFAVFVEGVWAQQPKYEDDWALILIKLGKEEYEMLYFPDGQAQALFIKDEKTDLISEEEINDGLSVDKEQECDSGEEVETVVSQEAKDDQSEQLRKLMNTAQDGVKESLEDDQAKEDLKDEITPIQDGLSIEPLEENVPEELQAAENHEEVGESDLEEMSEKEPIVVTEVPIKAINEAVPHQEAPTGVSETDKEDKDNQVFDCKYDDNTNK